MDRMRGNSEYAWKLLHGIGLCAVILTYLSFRDPLRDLLDASTQSIATEQREIRGKLVQQPGERNALRVDYSSIYGTKNQRVNSKVLKAFRGSMGDHWMSTVRVLVDGKQVAMGTVVRRDGWIVTKASEIFRGEIECRFSDQSRSPATLVDIRNDLDIGLLKVERSDLHVPTWGANSSIGSWIVTSDIRPYPLGIGVVGAEHRTINATKPVLGIGFEWTEVGNEVTMVLDGSGADKAGLRVGDLIESMDGRELKSRVDLLDQIRTKSAGERIALRIRRDDKTRDVSARLMDLTETLLDPTEMEVNGAISARSTNFSDILQHDTVIEPKHCGSPILNLQGEVVGINIARAGRVASYAIPTESLLPVIDSMLQSQAATTLAQKSDGSTIRSAKPALQ